MGISITIDKEQRNCFLWGERLATLCDANPTPWDNIFILSQSGISFEIGAIYNQGLQILG